LKRAVSRVQDGPRSACRVAAALVLIAIAGGTPTCPASAAPSAFSPVTGSPFATGKDAEALAFSPSGGLLGIPIGGDQVSVYSVGSGGTLSSVIGSPFFTSNGSDGPDAAAFSPSGGLFATGNSLSASVSVLAVGPGGALSAVANSPFAAGSLPASVAFSPSGELLAAADYSDSTVSVFSVGEGGALTQVPNSPFSTGSGSKPQSVAFSPSGGLLATANFFGNSVSVFSVGAGGQLSEVPNSPFSTGSFSNPFSVAFSPSGGLLATANDSGNSVSVFSVSAGGQLSEVANSPFSTGSASAPQSVAFSPSGALLATANEGGNSVSVFSVDPSTGELSETDGSPLSTGNGSEPRAVAFSPSGGLLASANIAGSVSVFSVAAPSATISSPASGAVSMVGQPLASSFSCADAHDGPGISSCTDSNGSVTPGRLETSTPGVFTYTVKAISKDGQQASTSITYTVVAAPAGAGPPALVAVPALSIPQLHPSAFAAAAHGAPVARLGKGATVSYRDTLAGITTFSVYHQAPGIRKGHRCVAPRHGPAHGRCVRLILVGSFTHPDHTGLNRFLFTGRLGGQALRPGSYALEATAKLDGHTSATVTARFRILAPG